MKEKGYLFVLAGRLTQDCVENSFFLIRAKQPAPNAFQFKQCLKEITVFQYMKVLSNTNYEEDDREFLGNFLNENKISTKNTQRLVDLHVHLDVPLLHVDNDTELTILYYIAGYLLYSISKTKTVQSMYKFC